MMESQSVHEPDTIIIGAGTVGAAIAYGLARLGQRVLVLDGGDTDFRAARANFGLVWVQGKGAGMPHYQRLSRRSSDLWPDFLTELRDAAGGVAIDYERRGGLQLIFGAKGVEDRMAAIARLEEERLALEGPGAEASDIEMLGRRELEGMLPDLRLGAAISGASYCRRDGHVNPLQLLGALHAAVRRLGGVLHCNTHIESVRPEAGGFVVSGAQESWRAARVVIAAGIATGRLGRDLGLDVPIFAQRGQVLVTQRVAPVLPYPCSGLRQTADGTFMIGATKENVGEDVSTTAQAAGWLARKTVDISPDLGRLQLVRHWAGLRTLSPDGCPIYAQSPVAPGAFVACCHSGVTLAATHAIDLSRQMAAGAIADYLDPFHHRRFNVQAAR